MLRLVSPLHKLLCDSFSHRFSQGRWQWQLSSRLPAGSSCHLIWETASGLVASAIIPRQAGPGSNRVICLTEPGKYSGQIILYKCHWVGMEREQLIHIHTHKHSHTQFLLIEEESMCTWVCIFSKPLSVVMYHSDLLLLLLYTESHHSLGRVSPPLSITYTINLE
jgi:hypothetical protein